MSTQHHYSTPLRFARGLFAAALLFAGGALFAQATDRYTETIEKFVAADRARPTEPGGVVFTGSSTITIWNSKLARDFPGINVIGRGFGGSTIPNHLNHAARTILPHKPSLIVFYCGENDIAGGRSPQQMAADFVSLCDLIFAELPDTRILYMGMKPSPKRWNLQPKFDEGNALVADYAARAFRVAYLDIKAPFLGADGRPRPELYANDELHLSPEGYKILKALVEPLLDPATQVVPVATATPAPTVAVSARPASSPAAAANTAPVALTEGVVIDFGADAHPTDSGETAWNNLGNRYQNDAGVIDLMDVKNRPTGMRLEVISPFSGANAAGVQTHARYPGTAARDSLFANTERFGGKENVTPEFRLAGLDPQKRYTLTFFASRMGSNDNRTTRYTIAGATTSAVELDAANNTDRTAVTTPLTPAADGTLTVTITPAESNNNANHFTYLGVLEIHTAP